MLADMCEADGSGWSGGSEREEVVQSGEGGVRGDGEGDGWWKVSEWYKVGVKLGGGLLSPESNLTNIWRFSDGLEVDEDEEEDEEVDEERDRTILVVFGLP